MGAAGAGAIVIFGVGGATVLGAWTAAAAGAGAGTAAGGATTTGLAAAGDGIVEAPPFGAGIPSDEAATSSHRQTSELSHTNGRPFATHASRCSAHDWAFATGVHALVKQNANKQTAACLTQLLHSPTAASFSVAQDEFTAGPPGMA